MNEEKQYDGNKVRITFELAAPYSTIQEELDDYISDIRELAEVRGFKVLPCTNGTTDL
ncbi:hypothetical protein AACH28_04780 [Sphingobacterium thalpophilum]|uniref:Uncharacterized protein n=1 Tax=Sphingobacterium thalpophilum TaxID=259 RepID=A0ACD5C4S6_9SPHI|nr:hypothetical protein [Sphingobacterium multivorum]